MTVIDWLRIIGHGDANHVLPGANLELVQTQFLQTAGVGREDEFRALDHQYAGTLRIFPVETDHGTHLHRPNTRLQGTHKKLVARCHGRFHRLEVGSMHFRIGVHFVAVSVKESDGISR